MKTKHKKNILIPTILIVLLISIAVAIYFAFFNSKNNNTQKTTEVQKVSEEKKEKTSNSPEVNNTKDEEPAKLTTTEQKDTQTNSDRPSAPILDQSLNKHRVAISSTSHDNGQEIEITGIINLSIQEGKCILSLTSPSGKSKTIETATLMAPSTSHCKVVKINKNTLEKGIWKYKLLYNTNEIIGESNENTFEIK